MHFIDIFFHWFKNKEIIKFVQNSPQFEWIRRKTKRRYFFTALMLFLYWFIFPRPLFQEPYSTVLVDKRDDLLGAHIAKDFQWRFPEKKNIPEKIEKALLQYEDHRFYSHMGIDQYSLTRAFYQYITKGRIISGGSTITMQVIRISRKNRDRNIFQKLIEMYFAFRMEFTYTKKEILSLYLSHAPFGGNVVGIDAAAWRYFQRKPEDLSWAESCMLAILPNSPALIHISRNRNLLLRKRNKLLLKLYEKEIIDKKTFDLAIEEPLPQKPNPYPSDLSHLTMKMVQAKPNQIIKTTIDGEIQKNAINILGRHAERLRINGIYNAAILILENKTGNVIAYIGNTKSGGSDEHGNDVDIIQSPRSTGSVLKPFLYAAMLTDGTILPTSLIADIPTRIGGFKPMNFNLSFDGAVPANRAIARSLNIPAVKMLSKYGVDKFQFILRKIGIASVNKSAEHYGLSLVIGGAESSLWEICGAYSSMARTLKNYSEHAFLYSRDDFHSPQFIEPENKKKTIYEDKSSWFTASAIWQTFYTMLEVERPDEENAWREFSSSQNIAWKTGTSYGFRDAWAVGINSEYTVGVWAGNADGEGRPELVGVKAAAPILFEIFQLLPSQSWFEKPHEDFVKMKVCRKSGFLASNICDEVDHILIPATGIKSELCPYHKMIHLDSTLSFQVNSNCEDVSKIIHKAWFVLPPLMEYYYRSHNMNYKTLPPFRDDCLSSDAAKIHNIDVIYPNSGARIYVPTELDGKQGKVVFEAQHRKADAEIFWYIDQTYVGSTESSHKLPVNPEYGPHILTLMDENGEVRKIDFNILQKKK